MHRRFHKATQIKSYIHKKKFFDWMIIIYKRGMKENSEESKKKNFLKLLIHKFF
jgi:hypothetical protein